MPSSGVGGAGWTAVVGAALLAATSCSSTSPSATPSPPFAARISTAPAPPPSASIAASPARPSSHRTTTRPVPAATVVRHAFPIAGCASSYGRSHHDYPATDIFSAAGCAVVSPVTGRVDEVSYVDAWVPSTNRGQDRGGLAVSVVGVDGVRYYGSHLGSIASGVRPGLQVRAGQLLGRVGSTGSARGMAAHLHFGISWRTPPGIWWVRRGAVTPWPYLDSWRAGGSRSPAAAVFALRARLGVVPDCRSYC